MDDIARDCGELVGPQGNETGAAQDMPDLLDRWCFGWPICRRSRFDLDFNDAELPDGMTFGHHQSPFGHAFAELDGFGMRAVIEVRLSIRDSARLGAFCISHVFCRSCAVSILAVSRIIRQYPLCFLVLVPALAAIAAHPPFEPYRLS